MRKASIVAWVLVSAVVLTVGVLQLSIKSNLGSRMLSGAPAPTGGGSGASEGIGVTGRWSIEVRNPDGSLALRREFHNALHQSGNRTLLTSLGSNHGTVGRWIVRATGSGIGADINEPLPQGVTDNGSPPTVNPTLKVTYLPSRESADRLQLSGSFVAENDGSVTTVRTLIRRCPGTVAPVSCPGNEPVSASVTQHTLDEPVPVVAGQQVLVTVEISFSTAIPTPGPTS